MVRMAKFSLEKQLEEFKKMSEQDLNARLNMDKEEASKRLKTIYGMTKSIENSSNPNPKLVEQRDKLGKEAGKYDKDSKKIEGYLKNKDKIEKIRSIQKTYLQKAVKIAREQKMTQAKINILEKNIFALEEKLAKDPSSVTNQDYVQLPIQKQEVEKLKAKMAEYAKQIASAQNAWNKCDMTWRALFWNKSWEEIHKRAIEDSKKAGRYTGSKEQMKPYKETAKEFAENHPKLAKAGEILQGAKDRILPRDEENKMPKEDFATRHPRLAKVRDFFKKIKDRFSRKEIKQLEAPIDNKQKDAFIEKLREMTELTPDERIEKRAEEQKQKSQRDDEYTR